MPAGRNTAITAIVLLFLSIVALLLAFALSRGHDLGAWQPLVEGLAFLVGIFLLWEAAVRWRSYRGGEIRGSLFGFLLWPLTARLLRWEAPAPE